ncbi:Phage Tail Collar Domain [Pseudomonas saponiphila]|uniref:Phage Tail Collar Domain n=1 Tax=Pseudomonas saponiphila TaxID=556534 RepID=A0A1H4Y3H3_9PSED|nr:phage tail protein [Pseudomonas saponiphila]SED12265.1 Phage Tail Collar Domain [Pseudomonas saponiphila]
MIDSNSQFFAILTAVGEAKQANATALGIPWTFKEMAVGDANGTDPIPNRAQTKLLNEWRRAPVNQVRTDPANPNLIITEQVIPSDVGGRWIREIGLFDADGDLVAVANCAPSFKPLLAQGTGKTQIIRMNFIVSNTAQIVLKIDPAVVLATREYVDNAVIDALARMDFKHSALVATTANIALSGIQTIDGVLLPADARVLVKNQTQAKDNGLYVVSSTGVWKRAQDADTSLEVTPGLFVSIETGAVNGDSVWQLVTDGPIVLGSTALTFDMVAGRTGVNAGAYGNVTVDKYGRVIAGTNPNTLAGHGITDTYTKAEIESIVAKASALSVGSIVAFPKTSVPPGFLEIDGSVQSAATYPDLAAYLGGTYNKGDEGTGNFRLPESRGEFLRGWDHGRGVDLGRGLGVYQLDALQNITGTISAADSTGLAQALTGVFSGSSASVTKGNVVAANAYTTVNFDASRVVRTATETRPRNLVVMWCIKAWSAPVNQANIDVAALAEQVRNMSKNQVVGLHRNLSCSASGLSALINVKADQLIVGNGAFTKSLSGIGLSISVEKVGANGLDKGPLEGSTWYAIWVIEGESGVAGLLSLSETVPFLPEGYSFKARVGWIRTDATASKYPLGFTQWGRRVQYLVIAGTNVPLPRQMASGVTGSPSSGLWTIVYVSAFVPPTAATIAVGVAAPTSNSSTMVAPNATYGGVSTLNNPPFAAVTTQTGAAGAVQAVEVLLEGPRVCWAGSGSGSAIYAYGWEDSL